MALYNGYSSFEYQRRKSIALKDIELVKMDILNHLFTKKGERVMMPNWGSIIPEVVFEPLDEATIRYIERDIAQVINYDPRVSLVELTAEPKYDEGRVEVHVLLDYLEFDLIDNMDLRIEFET